MNGSNENCFWLGWGAGLFGDCKYNVTLNFKRNYIHNLSSLPVAPFTQNIRDVLKADSGATKIYLQQQHVKYLEQVESLEDGLEAVLPDSTTIKASASGNLPLHENLNIKGLVYPHLNNISLLSIGQLCDNGCIAIFDKKLLHIIKNGKLVLNGKQNISDGLWDIPSKNTTSIHWTT